MTSLQQQIRRAIVERLTTCPFWQGKILDTPLLSFEEAQLPRLLLTVEKDQVLEDWTAILTTPLARNARIQLRELSLNLTLVAKTYPQGVPALDQLATPLMACLLADRTLGGLCKTLRFPETTELDTQEAGEPVCGVILRCVVWYRQVEDRPDRGVN